MLDFGPARGRAALRALVESVLGIPAGSDGAERAGALRRAIDEGLLGETLESFAHELLDLPLPAALRGESYNFV